VIKTIFVPPSSSGAEATSSGNFRRALEEIASGKRLQTWNMFATPVPLWPCRMQAKFNPNGRQVLAFNGDQARVWDITTNSPLFTLVSDGFNSAEHDPAGSTILTANVAGQAQVWNATNGAQQISMRALEHYSNVRGEFTATYSEDSKWIVTSARTGVRLWDTEEGVPLARTFPVGGGAVAAKLSAESRFLLMGCEDGTARAWDLISTEEGSPLLEHSDTLNQFRLSADGQRLYTASRDGTVGFWNVQTGRPLVEEFPHHQASTLGLLRLGLSDDDKHLFATDWDGNARVYDAYTGLASGPFLKHGPNRVSHAFLEGDHPCTHHMGTHDQVDCSLATTGRHPAPLARTAVCRHDAR
jgi:WD40 repeat protein